MAHDFDKKWRSKDVQLHENADFSVLLLSDRVLSGLTKAGFKKPSPIQLEAIPIGRFGKDLLVQAKSGTGKTLVFTIIALEMLKRKLFRPQVLILAPTREIATQISSVIQLVGLSFHKLTCSSFIGGLPVTEDYEKALTSQIVVGTPGRIRQLIKVGSMPTNSIRLLVFDEADQLLHGTFRPEIDDIFNTLPKDKQVIATSATYPSKLKKIIFQFLRDPHLACLNSSDLALLGIVHYAKIIKGSFMPILSYKFKLEALEQILKSVKFSQCLVFCNGISRVEVLCKDIKKWGFTTTYMSSAKEQCDRLKAIDRLKHFKCKVLVSSDVTSRGIDAENVDLVINFDLSHTTETYLHRVGRAGRYGSVGLAISLIAENQIQYLGKIESEGGFKSYKLPDPVPSDLIKNPLFDEYVIKEYTEPDFDAIGYADTIGTEFSNVEIAESGTAVDGEHDGIATDVAAVMKSTNIDIVCSESTNITGCQYDNNTTDCAVADIAKLTHAEKYENFDASKCVNDDGFEFNTLKTNVTDIEVNEPSELLNVSILSTVNTMSNFPNETETEKANKNSSYQENIQYFGSGDEFNIKDTNDNKFIKVKAVQNPNEVILSMENILSNNGKVSIQNENKFNGLKNVSCESSVPDSKLISDDVIQNLKFKKHNYFYQVLKNFPEKCNVSKASVVESKIVDALENPLNLINKLEGTNEVLTTQTQVDINSHIYSNMPKSELIHYSAMNIKSNDTEMENANKISSDRENILQSFKDEDEFNIKDTDDNKCIKVKAVKDPNEINISIANFLSNYVKVHNENKFNGRNVSSQSSTPDSKLVISDDIIEELKSKKHDYFYQVLKNFYEKCNVSKVSDEDKLDDAPENPLNLNNKLEEANEVLTTETYVEKVDGQWILRRSNDKEIENANKTSSGVLTTVTQVENSAVETEHEKNCSDSPQVQSRSSQVFDSLNEVQNELSRDKTNDYPIAKPKLHSAPDGKAKSIFNELSSSEDSDSDSVLISYKKSFDTLRDSTSESSTDSESSNSSSDYCSSSSEDKNQYRKNYLRNAKPKRKQNYTSDSSFCSIRHPMCKRSKMQSFKNHDKYKDLSQSSLIRTSCPQYNCAQRGRVYPEQMHNPVSRYARVNQNTSANLCGLFLVPNASHCMPYQCHSQSSCLRSSCPQYNRSRRGRVCPEQRQNPVNRNSHVKENNSGNLCELHSVPNASHCVPSEHQCHPQPTHFCHKTACVQWYNTFHHQWCHLQRCANCAF